MSRRILLRNEATGETIPMTVFGVGEVGTLELVAARVWGPGAQATIVEAGDEAQGAEGPVGAVPEVPGAGTAQGTAAGEPPCGECGEDTERERLE